jgi:hypothetical protein
MNDFINSIDQLGDDVVLGSIIDGSITEFKDSVLTSVRRNAFYGCTNLTTVDLRKVTNIPTGTFFNCTNLTTLNIPNVTDIETDGIYDTKITKLDLPNIRRIANKGLYNCANLTTLILRSNTLCTLENVFAFYGGPIKNGTGYIYVPSALKSQYVSASEWKSLKPEQFRALEDYTVDGTITGELDPTKI